MARREPPLPLRALRPALRRVLVPPLRLFNRLLRRISGAAHHFQLRVEGVLTPQAEWFDHHIDVHWQWPATGRSSFLERGVYNSLVIEPGADVLELCSGDGFYTRNFYAPKASSVVAVDANPEALAHARRVNGAENVRYESCDIRRTLPEGPFANVIWDSALHHFTPEEVGEVLALVRERMAPGAVLSGYTEVEDLPYAYRKQSFESKDDVVALLGRSFPHVMVFETSDPHRTNLYFFASDSAERLPFAPGNPHLSSSNGS
jgi:phospholipid N-methyltransferase